MPDAMTLGKGGEAITTDQVISKEQFESVFLDALKAPGGSFKFIPVMDSEGTEMPGATEQTVSIGFNYVHHFQSEPSGRRTRVKIDSRTTGSTVSRNTRTPTAHWTACSSWTAASARRSSWVT